MTRPHPLAMLSLATVGTRGDAAPARDLADEAAAMSLRHAMSGTPLRSTTGPAARAAILAATGRRNALVALLSTTERSQVWGFVGRGVEEE